MGARIRVLSVQVYFLLFCWDVRLLRLCVQPHSHTLQMIRHPHAPPAEVFVLRKRGNEAHMLAAHIQPYRGGHARLYQPTHRPQRTRRHTHSHTTPTHPHPHTAYTHPRTHDELTHPHHPEKCNCSVCLFTSRLGLFTVIPFSFWGYSKSYV